MIAATSFVYFSREKFTVFYETGIMREILADLLVQTRHTPSLIVVNSVVMPMMGIATLLLARRYSTPQTVSSTPSTLTPCCWFSTSTHSAKSSAVRPTHPSLSGYRGRCSPSSGNSGVYVCLPPLPASSPCLPASLPPLPARPVGSSSSSPL